MFKVLSLLAISVFVQTASAGVPNLCVPSVAAEPTPIFCRANNGRSVVIEIETLMSPPACQGPRQEVKAATVTIEKKNGAVVRTLRLGDDEFSYELSPGGDAAFKSEKYGLDLKRCISPVHGGFSVGN